MAGSDHGEAARVSLFGRIFLLNALVLVVAAALLVFGPATVSTPALSREVLVLASGLVVMLIANAVLIRVGLAPLGRLTRAMTTIDLLKPGPRLQATGHGEIAELITTFNSMIDRLEAERGYSSAIALSAQESERRRVAQELHDEVGQSLTAVLLSLKRVADQSPQETREELLQVQETTRSTLDEIRRIARRLRPGVLEELGLVSALKALTNEISEPTGLAIRRRFDKNLPPLDAETELVVYRVAQEGLTNTIRHSGADEAELSLKARPSQVELTIRDNGRGIGTSQEGAGIRGMRERALLVGADLEVGAAPGRGTEVRLTVKAKGAGE
ncbi:HAMP domain-containing sensor histidine kinase [Lentzea albida]|uniref:HAMP domain-containing sensor histidine kinase n=1 Tax=Lentzea albida TaxID=65499 RepID=UPI001FE2AC78|nr:HAMP domain-containing sensor histidine kinase [Lentzea albida]